MSSPLSFSPETIESVPLSALKPYPRNPRMHSDEQVEKIVRSIATFGWTIPVLIDDQNEVIAGHGRLMAAEKLGISNIPSIRIKHLTQDQVKALRIADNQTVIAGGWDKDILGHEIHDLGLADFNLSLLGFDTPEIDGYLTPFRDDGLTNEDDAPEAQEECVSRIGDLYMLGTHLLLCGDATNKTDVTHILNGRTPHLMVTDPPYGVDYDPDWRNRADRANGKPYGGRAIGLVTNDDCASWTEALSLFSGDVAYVWCASLRIADAAAAIIDCGFELRASLIWVKNVIVIGRGHYHWQHEPCWYAVRKGRNGHWQGDRTQSTIWEIGKPSKSETGHSTQKPVECMRKPIENNSARGESVYDPFCGSGTTIIAAEQTNRICYAIEIAPKYVDVAVRRWQNYTGKQAILELSGKTFEEVAEARTKETVHEIPSPASDLGDPALGAG